MPDQYGLPFNGAKVALINGPAIVTILRDDIPTIPYPNMWDLPGGGREGNETPKQCALREVEEELGLRFSEAQIIWERHYPKEDALLSWFFAIEITDAEIARIQFGSEGQCWKQADIRSFIHSMNTVPNMSARVATMTAVLRPGLADDRSY